MALFGEVLGQLPPGPRPLDGPVEDDGLNRRGHTAGLPVVAAVRPKHSGRGDLGAAEKTQGGLLEAVVPVDGQVLVVVTLSLIVAAMGDSPMRLGGA
jgi:hypothetical protein